MGYARVTFLRVARRDRDQQHAAPELQLRATVQGQPVGPEGASLASNVWQRDLEFALWSADVRYASELELTFEVQQSGEQPAQARYRMRWFRQAELHLEAGDVLVVVRVIIRRQGAYRWQAPDTVLAARGDSQVTVAMTPRMHVEIDPVYPRPQLQPLPPSWAGQNEGGAYPHHSAPALSPVNALCNPAVIPMLDAATEHSAAKLVATRWWPRTLSGRLLQWRSVPLERGAEVAFLGGGRGLTSLAYGRAAGLVRVELCAGDNALASYRALVRPIVRIPYRYTFFRIRDDPGHPWTTMRIAPRQVPQLMRLVNTVLRQVAIELVPDTVASTDASVRPTNVPGVFEREVALWRPDARTDPMVHETEMRPAERDWVVNIHHSHWMHPEGIASFPPIAVAFRFPDSLLGQGRGHIEQSGAPTPSWIGETSTPPSNAAIRMQYAGGEPANNQQPRWALAINNFRIPPWRPAYWATTVAHEVAHTLNLYHRGRNVRGSADDDEWDLIDERIERNLMVGSAGNSEQHTDLDILQARVIHKSRLVDHYLRQQYPDIAAHLG